MLKLMLTIVIALVSLLILSLCVETYAVSPSFSNQRIQDGLNDVQIAYNYGDPSDCNLRNRERLSSDIYQVDYISDGRTLNATIWPFAPFDDRIRETLDLRSAKINDTQDDYVEDLIRRYQSDGYKIVNFDKNGSLAGHNASVLTAEIPGFVTEDGSRYVPINGSYRLFNVTFVSFDFITKVNDTLYRLQFFVEPERFDEHLPTVSRIVNSVKIGNTSTILPNTTDDSSGFSTFERSDSDIMLEYPSNWTHLNRPDNPDIDTFMAPQYDVMSSQDKIIALQDKYFRLTFDINSEYDTPPTNEYVVDIVPDSDNSTWRYLLWQGNPNYEWYTEPNSRDKLLEKRDNSSGFFKIHDNYIELSVDLRKMNYPERYTTTIFLYIDSNMCFLWDFTSAVVFPPPEFNVTVSPSTVILRPGEQKSLEFKVKSDAAKGSLVELDAAKIKGVETEFIPSNFSLPSLGEATSILTVKAAENNTLQGNYILNTNQEISLSTTTTLAGGTEERSKVGTVSTSNKSTPLTITLLPPLTFEERLDNFVNAWISPIGILWTLLAGIAAVIAPLVIRIYSKRKKERPLNSDSG